MQPYLSYGIALWGQAARTILGKILVLQNRALRLIHFKPFRFHAEPLFKLSNVLPLNLLYFKTICLIMHDLFNNVTPPNISNIFTYSSKIHHHITRFSAAGNCHIKHSRRDHLNNSFSSIGSKIWNSIPVSDCALPKYKFNDILHNRLLDTPIQGNIYVAVYTLVGIFSKYSQLHFNHKRVLFHLFCNIYVLPTILISYADLRVSVLFIVVSTPITVIFYFSYPPRLARLFCE